MNSTRALAFAALAALSLGVGSAMAQEGPEFFEPNAYWENQAAPAPMQARHAAAPGYMPQAGSADRPVSQPYLGASDFSTAGSE